MSRRITFCLLQHRSKRAKVYERDNFTCVLCGWKPSNIPKKYDGMRTIIDGDNRLTIDHVIPLSKGGNNYYHNLQTTCEKCNNAKDNKIMIDNDLYVVRLSRNEIQ